MTTLEIILCIVCPALVILWIAEIALHRFWRYMAEFWRERAINQRRHHPLRDCIRRAGEKNGNHHSIGTGGRHLWPH